MVHFREDDEVAAEEGEGAAKRKPLRFAVAAALARRTWSSMLMVNTVPRSRKGRRRRGRRRGVGRGMCRGGRLGETTQGARRGGGVLIGLCLSVANLCSERRECE